MKSSKRYILVGTLIVVFVTLICCAVWYNADKFVLETREPVLQTALLEERIPMGEARENITYCDNQKLDFYAPIKTTTEKSPLIIYIHGGGWRMNNKDSDENMRALFDGLRDKGYALASIDYSLTPQYQYPKPQQDVLCAVRFLRANTERFAIDGNKIVVTGFSAGANLAALIATNNTNTLYDNGLYSNTSQNVQAFVGIGGVYDFTNTLRPNSIGNIRNLMQNAKPSEGSPTSYVYDKSAPALLIHGDKDSIVYAAQSENYGTLLVKNNVTGNVVIVKNAEHDLSNTGGDAAPNKDEIISQITNFINQQLGL